MARRGGRCRNRKAGSTRERPALNARALYCHAFPADYLVFEMIHQLVPSDCTWTPLTKPLPGGFNTYGSPSAGATPETLHVFGDCAVRLTTNTLPEFAAADGS